MTKSKKTTTTLRSKEERILLEVPSLIPLKLFESVQKKLIKNAELSKRNTKGDYLLSGLLYCSQCGGRMGGHTVHNIPYYRCYRKGNPDRVPLSPDGRPQPCSCPEVKAELERQLAKRLLTQNHEDQIKSLAEKISAGIDSLDFGGKQELLRLLVEKVGYNGQNIEILTIIPLGEQLHPIPGGGQRGWVT